jgi:hypothetical protein
MMPGLVNTYMEWSAGTGEGGLETCYVACEDAMVQGYYDVEVADIFSEFSSQYSHNNYIYVCHSSLNSHQN